MNGHDELISLLGAYALDAVDDDERRAIEEHLEVCAICRAEVAQHLEVAGALGVTASTAAPDDLWAAILDQIDDGPAEAPATPALPGLADRRPVQPTAPAPDPGAGVGGVIALDQRRRPTGWMAGLAAAAAIIVVLLTTVVTLRSQNSDLETQLARSATTTSSVAPSVADLARTAAADPANQRLELTADDGTDTAEAVVTPSGQGYLVTSTLDPLPADRTYQLWNISDAGPVSLGVLGNDPGASAFHVQGPLGTLAITAERAGGVPSPENIPLVTATA